VEHTAFSVPLNVTDKVLMIHPAVAYMLGLTTARAGYLDNLSAGPAALEADNTVPVADVGTNLLIRDVAGNKADAAKYAVTADQSLVAMLKGVLKMTVLATGTFTTSSATVPADTGRTEGTDYWNGCILLPLTGVVAMQPRLIRAFTITTGVFTIDDGLPFTAAPGLVTYAILAFQQPTAPAVDSLATKTTSATVGNKGDTAVTTSGATASIVAYLKGLINRSANLVAIVSTTGSPYSQPNDLVENDAIVVAAGTQLVDIEIDLSNLAQANTLREYVKVDGVNYQQISSKIFPTDYDPLTKVATFYYPQKGVAYKITMQSSVLEGGVKNVPFRVMTRALA
jgi:hypothetical protein